MIQRTAWSTLVAVQNQAQGYLIDLCSFTAQATTIPLLVAALENHSADNGILALALQILCTIGLRARQPGGYFE
jgi:hypothetical protein